MRDMDADIEPRIEALKKLGAGDMQCAECLAYFGLPKMDVCRECIAATPAFTEAMAKIVKPPSNAEVTGRPRATEDR